MWLKHLVSGMHHRFWRRPSLSPNLLDPSDQLRLVESATFAKKKVMHWLEYRVFRIVEEEAASLRAGARVFAQTALGEIVRSDDRLAHKSINSKRADIVVIGADGFALAAVEYQGAGHFQQKAATKDAVKREALRRAGIQYVEILNGYTDDEIRQSIRTALRTAVALAQSTLRTPIPKPGTRTVARRGNSRTNGAPEGAPASMQNDSAQTE